MLVHRILKSKYAHEPLSAEGAQRAGGRWNPKGFPILYTSATPELALLEVIAHFEPSYIPNYNLLVLSIPDPKRQLNADDLPPSWRTDTPYDKTTQYFLLDWLRTPDLLAIGVPSAIVERSTNYLIHMQYPSFMNDIQVVENNPFKIDLRLVRGTLT